MKYCFTLLVALAFTVGVGCSKDEGGSTPAKTPDKSTTDSTTDTAGDAMKEGGDAMKAATVSYECSSCAKEVSKAGDRPPPS